MNKKSRQQITKLSHGKCFFCEENNYKLLDAHRILEGADNGTYNPWNILVLCALCHRKCHTGIIKIKGKFKCTCAKGFVIIYEEEGKEYIK